MEKAGLSGAPSAVVTCGHMARQIGIRELRDTLTATVRRVRNGETLEVTHDGKPVAILSPIPDDRVGRLLARPDVSAPTEERWPASGHPVTGDRSASEALEDDRAER